MISGVGGIGGVRALVNSSFHSKLVGCLQSIGRGRAPAVDESLVGRGVSWQFTAESILGRKRWVVHHKDYSELLLGRLSAPDHHMDSKKIQCSSSEHSLWA